MCKQGRRGIKRAAVADAQKPSYSLTIPPGEKMFLFTACQLFKVTLRGRDLFCPHEM